jgi:hypothetical protein
MDAAMTGRPDLHGLIRAGKAAQERKYRELEMMERVRGLSRAQLESESETLGIAHAGLDDDTLRLRLIAEYRKAIES